MSAAPQYSDDAFVYLRASLKTSCCCSITVIFGPILSVGRRGSACVYWRHYLFWELSLQLPPPEHCIAVTLTAPAYLSHGRFGTSQPDVHFFGNGNAYGHFRPHFASNAFLARPSRSTRCFLHDRFLGLSPCYPPDFARGKPKRYALLCAAARFTGRPQPVIYLAPESVPPERTVSHVFFPHRLSSALYG